MQQLTLALPAETRDWVLVDDATGRIVYTPRVVDAKTCAAWFAELNSQIAWRHERRPMYDRIVDVPRLTAHYDVEDLLPRALAAALIRVERFTGVRFSSIGLNLYRDGRDSVAMHNDHLSEMEPRSPIALLSLGETRRMRIHSKAQPRRAFDLALEPGSVLVMTGAAQEHWEHGVPKTAEALGPRISLAFRKRPRREGTQDPVA